MRVQDVMTRNPRCVTPQTPAREAARIMKDEDVGIVPVVDEKESQRLLGVVTDRDLAVRIVADGHTADTRVSEIMSRGDLVTCPADAELNDAMDRMATEQVRRIPIVDERGNLVGIVSQADLVRKARSDDRAEDTIERISQPGGRHST